MTDPLGKKVEEANHRVSVAQIRAVSDLYSRRTEFTSVDEWSKAVATAVVNADDDKTRCVVVVRDPSGFVAVFGVYATENAAMKALQTGALAFSEGARGAVVHLSRHPRAVKATKQPRKKATK